MRRAKLAKGMLDRRRALPVREGTAMFADILIPERCHFAHRHGAGHFAFVTRLIILELAPFSLLTRLNWVRLFRSGIIAVAQNRNLIGGPTSKGSNRPSRARLQA
jgi:hypothetical protein